MVAFTKTGERLVGDAAKRQAVTNSKNTVYSIKRFMGRKYNEVEEERKRVPYKVVSGVNGDAAVEVGGVRVALEQHLRQTTVQGHAAHQANHPDVRC